MDGPSHYREAERLLKFAGGEVGPEAHEDRLVAQVHATLALAAATAINAPMPNRATPAEVDAWRGAAGARTEGVAS